MQCIDVEMPNAILSCTCYWIMAASVPAAGEVMGTCTTVPVGACNAHVIAAWDTPSLGAAAGTQRPRPLCALLQGWIDPCSKRLHIKKLIMQLRHTVSSETMIVLDMV